MTTIADVSRELIRRRGFAEFVRQAWPIVCPGEELLWNWHIEELCAHLQANTEGRMPKVLANVPPGCSKTLITTVFWPAWEWTIDPTRRFIVVSYDVGLLCARSSARMLDLVRSTWYEERWGHLVDDDVGVREFTNVHGGWRYNTSVEGKVTGQHGDVVIVDDPVKPLECTPAALEKCEQWWRGTIQTRFRDLRKKRFAVIMQRLHEADLSGIILAQGGWIHLRFPARYEPKEPCYTPIGGDPRTEEGQLLGDPRLGEAQVAEQERLLGPRDFAAQYQQRPNPAGGAVFKREWFRRYDAPPPRFDMIVMSVDCAFKGTSTSDYVVVQVWGVVGAKYYLLDQIRERLDFPGTVAAIRAMARKWPKCVSKLVEDKANGPAVIALLDKEIPGLIAVDPEGGKEARANAVAPLYEAGDVLHPNAPWTDALEEELLIFPAGRNDDQVDTTSQALGWIYRRHSSYAAAMAGARKIFGPRLA